MFLNTKFPLEKGSLNLSNILLPLFWGHVYFLMYLGCKRWDPKRDQVFRLSTIVDPYLTGVGNHSFQIAL